MFRSAQLTDKVLGQPRRTARIDVYPDADNRVLSAENVAYMVPHAARRIIFVHHHLIHRLKILQFVPGVIHSDIFPGRAPGHADIVRMRDRIVRITRILMPDLPARGHRL